MVRVGIIGSGFGVRGLLPAFISVKNCEVVAFCGKESEEVLRGCREAGVKNVYRNWREMLEEEELDALAIAVIPSAQYEIAKAAILEGIHVFAEKPLAVNYAQAKELLDLAKKKKVKHALDFMFPEIEEWVKVKEIIDSKKYGRLKELFLDWDFLSYDIKNQSLSWKTDVTQGGGALSLYLSHSLYYLEYFAGRILDFKAEVLFTRIKSQKIESGVDMQLKFKDATGKVHLSSSSPGLAKHKLRFAFEGAVVDLENNEMITSDFTITISESSGTRKMKINKQNIKGQDERAVIVSRIAERFVNSIIDNTENKPDFEDGVRVQKLIDQIRAV